MGWLIIEPAAVRHNQRAVVRRYAKLFPFHAARGATFQESPMEDIGKLLPAIFRKQVRRSSPSLVEFLAPLWPRVAGRPIAQHSRPATFEQGTLTLLASCPSWSAELRRMAEEIRAGINSYMGTPIVKKLRVQYAPSLGLGDRPGETRNSEEEISPSASRPSIEPARPPAVPPIPPQRVGGTEGSPKQGWARAAGRNRSWP